MADSPKVQQARELLDKYDAVKIRIHTILEKGMQLHENIWKDDEAFWEDARKHPDKFKARLVSFNTFFSRFAANRAQPEAPARPRVTADQLQELVSKGQVSDDQVEQWAMAKEDDPTSE